MAQFSATNDEVLVHEREFDLNMLNGHHGELITVGNPLAEAWAAFRRSAHNARAGRLTFASSRQIRRMSDGEIALPFRGC
jgi:hypothetical protein